MVIKPGDVVLHNSSYYLVLKLRTNIATLLDSKNKHCFIHTDLLSPIKSLPYALYGNEIYFYSEKTDTLYNENGVVHKNPSEREELIRTILIGEYFHS
jgi:hypothetical protein